MTTVYIDYETFLIQPGCLAPPPVCLVYAIDFGAPQLVHAHFDPMFALLEGWLRDPNTTLVAHYAVFEALVTLAAKPEWTTLVFDKLRAGKLRCTLVREKLIRIARGDPREGYGLDACLEAWRIPITLDKASYWRPRFGTLYGLPCSEWPEEARAYVLGDIAVRDLYLAQETAGAAILHDQDAQMRAALALALTSAWGMTTDPVAAEKLYLATESRLEEHKKVVFESGLARFQKKAGELVLVKDKKAAEARLVAAYEASGREPPRGKVTEKMAAKGTEQGNVKLDEEACALSGDPVLESYTAYSQAGTLLSKVRRLQRSPIQASYNVLVNTGRTSCRQGDDPEDGEAWTSYGMNVQNLPRDGEAGEAGARECFVARPGHAIVSIDFDAFELRTWSQACIDLLGFSDMAEVLRDPARCPHVEMGALVEGMSSAEAYALKKTDPIHFKKLRQLAKAINFGAPGGLGAARFGEFARGTYGVDVSEARAKELLKKWRQLWREAGAYLEMIERRVGARGNRISIEHLRSKRLRGSVGYCDSANSFFQGLASDAAKAGLVALMYEEYENKTSSVYGCRTLAFIHDEVLLEVPLERLHEAAYRARDVFVAGAQVFVPDIPLTASPAAQYRWSKKAGDPIHDSGGRLICYPG